VESILLQHDSVACVFRLTVCTKQALFCEAINTATGALNEGNPDPSALSRALAVPGQENAALADL
jgi:hypothetical protein